MKKRIISILLTVLMIVSMIPLAAVPAFAEDEPSVPQEIPAALQNTSWKGEMKVQWYSEGSMAEEIGIFILQLGTDSAYFTYTYKNETIILPYMTCIKGEDEEALTGEILVFQTVINETEANLLVRIEDGAVVGIMADIGDTYMAPNGDVFKITTLRDILGKIGGGYSGYYVDDSGRNVKMLITINGDELCMDTIIPDVEAYRWRSDHNGYKEWETYEFDGFGQPVFPDEPDREAAGTVDLALSHEVEITEEEITLENGCVIPAGSYYASEVDMAFFDEQDGKTQMLYTGGLVVRRGGDTAPKTLRDIIGKVGGTYSGILTDGSTTTITFDAYEVRFDTIGSDWAERTVIDADGTKIWRTEEFDEFGQPVFDGEPETGGIETIETFLNYNVEILIGKVDVGNGVVIPAGSYVVGKTFVFCNEQNGVTQKLFLGRMVELDRVGEDDPDTLTLRDILDTVSGTYSVSIDSGSYITVALNENEFLYEMVDSTVESAFKYIVNADGSAGWIAESFEDGKPAYGSEPQNPGEPTIDMLLTTEIKIAEKETATGAPAGSYVLDLGLFIFAFYDEDEESGKTQKLNFDSLVLDRVGEHEHEFSDVEYTWVGADCTATVTCTGCTETVTETVTGIFKQDTAATCTEAARGHYEATFNNTVLGSAQTEANSVTNGNPKGHDFSGEVKSNGNGTHSFKCVNGCNDYGGTEKCIDGNGDFVCDNCKYEFLAEAKAAAIAEINKLAGNNPGEAVKAIASKALADIGSAKTVAAVNSIKDQALKDIKAQQEAENPTEPTDPGSGSFLSKLLEQIRDIFKNIFDTLFGWLPFC